ncbi:MAG: hypothetical protein M0Q95_14830 [Porticoccaceae bacterium]|nr:hypothetical protein [Porticoccaceae bacterium]
MNIATLRAEGSDAALTSLREAFNLEVDAGWKKGEPRRRGGVHERSGLNACIADVASATMLVAEIQAFLAMCLTRRELFSSELSAQVDIGITVGERGRYFASVVLPPNVLKVLAELGIELRVSAYPGSDDE